MVYVWKFNTNKQEKDLVHVRFYSRFSSCMNSDSFSKHNTSYNRNSTKHVAANVKNKIFLLFLLGLITIMFKITCKRLYTREHFMSNDGKVGMYAYIFVHL